MDKEFVTSVLNVANNNLKDHPEFESWMVFDGADVLKGKIIPRFKTKDGKSGFQDSKFPVYLEVWKETAISLGL